MPSPFEKINRALQRKKDQGVERKGLDLDEETRKKREQERMAAAKAKRLRDLGIDPNARVK